MKIPVGNIADVLSAAFDIEKAKETPVSVLVMLDESASPAFQVFVRAGFSSESVNSRLMVGYYPTMQVDPGVEVDLVVLAAGQGTLTGKIAADFAANGVPVLVVAESAPRVCQIASEQGFELDPECVIGPEVNQDFDDDIKGALADRIGNWMAHAVANDKHLAFSIAYPFMRRPLAYAAINQTAAQNAGVGVVSIIPGADMPVMTVNQMKMLLQIAAAYGEPLTADRVKELAAVFGSGIVFRGVARTIVGIVPVGGWAVKGAMGFAGTQAIGHAAIDYFEHGGNAAGLASVVGHTREKIVSGASFIAEQPVTQTVMAVAGPGVTKVAGGIVKHAKPVANSAIKAFVGAKRHGAKKTSDKKGR